MLSYDCGVLVFVITLHRFQASSIFAKYLKKESAKGRFTWYDFAACDILVICLQQAYDTNFVV